MGIETNEQRITNLEQAVIELTKDINNIYDFLLEQAKIQTKVSEYIATYEEVLDIIFTAIGNMKVGGTE